MKTEAGLTCGHDGHLSSYDTFHAQAEQSSSHQTAGEGQILQTQTGSLVHLHTRTAQRNQKHLLTSVPSYLRGLIQILFPC